MFKNILLLVAVSIVILGCYSKDLNLKIRFVQTEGLRADDRIIFEKNHIGKVNAISYSERGDYIADVKIDKGFKKAVTEHSRFFIINEGPDLYQGTRLTSCSCYKSAYNLCDGGTETMACWHSFGGCLIQCANSNSSQLV